MRDIFRKLMVWLGLTTTRLVCLANRIKYVKAIKEETKQNPQPKLSELQKKEIKKYFDQYGFKNVSTRWHRFYGGFNKYFSTRYIPQDLFFSHIELALNNQEYGTLQDKNLLRRMFEDVPQPITIMGKIGALYSKDGKIVSKKKCLLECLNHDNFIIKPTTATYGGHGIIKYDICKDDRLGDYQKLSKILDSYNEDFIVQKLVAQSDSMKKLNTTSLNTIRISSYLRSEEVVILFSIVRFGAKGVFLDNISQGGFYCQISDDGSLHKHAYNTDKKTISKTEEGTILEDFPIPNYEGVKELVKSVHQRVPYFKMISWDLALDTNDMPVLIEFNAFGQSIDFQAITGPLFGEYTDEVLDITKRFKENTTRVNIIKVLKKKTHNNVEIEKIDRELANV